ncbi:HpcH/HpaI aldolase/citrate lyase family protein [Pelagibius sp. Alg239-R121]|uniref:HpcH/HpaI aldolase family protein n=1 Tax=Pelagibius sp. Alg239-R121 TaxID=2993448 RepID=UPI0024A633F4|nr:aldolase/citrate lyase family protein [Pelagibius sp. Alg239-R121]
MIKNGLKSLWAEGKPALNGWLSIANSFSAEIVSAQGYDSVTVDLQHGIIDYSGAVPMLQAMRASGVTPMVRVPWLDAGAIMKALDAGAYGIICPMVNSRAEAEQLVSYMRYPPRGTRSFGPTRANFSAGAGYAAEANDEVLCLAMIETAEAMENLEEIVSTPGLDGVYIGPADLTIGVTNGRLPPGFDREEPEMIEAIQRILAAAKTAGIRACLHCGSPAYAAKAIGWGFDLVTLLNDVRLLAASASASVSQTRELLGHGTTEEASDTKGY